MANFISSLDCCCSIGNDEKDALQVIRELKLIMKDTGKEVDFGFYSAQNIPDGTVLIAKSKWSLKKNYTELAKFDTEAEAQAELQRIVDELAKSNLVVQVNK